MNLRYRFGRVRWDLVGWLLALVGGVMSLFGQPADATEFADKGVDVHGQP